MFVVCWASIPEINPVDKWIEYQFLPIFLPLDFQARVRQDWEIEFKYYSKPMASTLVIQNGTALAKQTVFSSLRQDLIRRLSNISEHLRSDEQLNVIENFIQSLADSGHKYSFSKSVVLQALTRFKYIIERNELDPNNKRFNPMYRDKYYKFAGAYIVPEFPPPRGGE